MEFFSAQLACLSPVQLLCSVCPPRNPRQRGSLVGRLQGYFIGLHLPKDALGGSHTSQPHIVHSILSRLLALPFAMVFGLGSWGTVQGDSLWGGFNDLIMPAGRLGREQCDLPNVPPRNQTSTRFYGPNKFPPPGLASSLSFRQSPFPGVHLATAEALADASFQGADSSSHRQGRSLGFYVSKPLL